MIAWMAFLSGDHPSLFSMMGNINEIDLGGPEESSMFYSLKAMIGYMMDTEEGLRYAKRSLDILSNEKESFYLANAKLTYGQMLASTQQYRLASEMFASSYRIFHSQDLHFLAVVAMVNEALNRYKMGDFHEVIKQCNEVLLRAGTFHGKTEGYWNAVHLPLGMCYHEMNKPYLAIEHLTLAKASIDEMGLFHMHGLIELYLFKSYYMIHDVSAMVQLKDEVIAKFQNMHYEQIDLMVSMFKIFLVDEIGLHKIQADIENLEFEYAKNGVNSHATTIDSLVFLKLKGLSDLISIEVLETRLRNLKYIGMIPQIQQTMLQLSELNYLENNHKQAIYHLRDAVQVYKEFGIYASFCALSPSTLEKIIGIDKGLYSLLNKSIKGEKIVAVTTLLTTREKEIMRLVAMGKTNEEMSKTLFISVGTIKWHINHIFGKLEVKNRVQAIEKARTFKEI